MKCANHPDLEASVRCEGCAEPFCPDCIVDVAGQSYCSACKVITVKNRKRAPARPKNGPVCKEAYVALICSLFGLLCCCLGIVLHPVALTMGSSAAKQIRSSQNMTGLEIARSAQAIAIIGLVVLVLQVVARLLFRAQAIENM